jgi:hypothetical protein
VSGCNDRSLNLILFAGLIAMLAPSWAIDAFEGVSAAISSFEDDTVPPLEEDPAVAMLAKTHDIYINGAKYTPAGVDVSVSEPSPDRNAVVTHHTTGEKEKTPTRRLSATSDVTTAADQLVFDPVFGVISKDLRDRWRKQERDARIALEVSRASCPLFGHCARIADRYVDEQGHQFGRCFADWLMSNFF